MWRDALQIVPAKHLRRAGDDGYSTFPSILGTSTGERGSWRALALHGRPTLLDLRPLVTLSRILAADEG